MLLTVLRQLEQMLLVEPLKQRTFSFFNSISRLSLFTEWKTEKHDKKGFQIVSLQIKFHTRIDRRNPEID